MPRGQPGSLCVRAALGSSGAFIPRQVRPRAPSGAVSAADTPERSSSTSRATESSKIHTRAREHDPLPRPFAASHDKPYFHLLKTMKSCNNSGSRFPAWSLLPDEFSKIKLKIRVSAKISEPFQNNAVSSTLRLRSGLGSCSTPMFSVHTQKTEGDGKGPRRGTG